MKEAHVIFRGRVQGVFFRATTQQIATDLGLNGSVQNLSDGTVEMYVEGSEKDILELVQRLELEFSLDPKVSTDVSLKESSGRFSLFQILY